MLVARTIAYALSPDPAAAALSSELGGPTLVMITAISLALAALVAVIVVALASIAVRERAHLNGTSDRPRIRPVAAAGRAGALFAAAAVLFAAVESTIHWQAGYGFDPAHCLAGPVHTNAVPILAALAIIASAAIAAGDLLVAWARRTLRAATAAALRLVPDSTPANAVWRGTVPAVAARHDAPPRAPPYTC
jgi:hypothetical protein